MSSLTIISCHARANFATETNAIQQLVEKKADIYCLQEIASDSELVKSLQKNQYKLIGHKETDGNYDTAIAYSQRFQQIGYGDTSFQLTLANKKAHIAFVKLMDGDAQIGIMSLHSSGKEYCQEATKHLHRMKDCSIQVIGAGMHTNPEFDQESFQKFTEFGLNIIRLNQAKYKKIDQTDETDFIFANVDKSSSLFSNFLSMIYPVEPPLKAHSLFDAQNSSDHLALIKTFSLEQFKKQEPLSSETGVMMASGIAILFLSMLAVARMNKNP